MSVAAINDAKTQIRNMLKEAKYPQARIYATQILKNHGDDAELFYLRGTACAHRSAVDQAEKDLRAAIALKPGEIDYYLTLCNLLFSAGKYERAFGEYIRVRNVAPANPKVKAFAEIFNGPQGKLNAVLHRLEAEYKSTEYKTRISDQLVTLYSIKALFDWHARHQNKSLAFYASNTTQLEHAEYFLEKIRMLPVTTSDSRQKKVKLENLIALNRRKKFDGFISDRVFAIIIVITGLVSSGMIDLIYALSAASSFIAFIRPNYLKNRARSKIRLSSGYLDRVLDFVYGDSISSSARVFSGISNANIRSVTVDLLRGLLRAVLMPMSVFAGFYKNFSVNHAVSFVLITVLLATAFAR